MPASLCIQIYSGIKDDTREIKFFEANLWTSDSEKLLIVKIQELLSIVRKIGSGFEINICMDVTDVNEAVFLISKKVNAHTEINNLKLSIREIEILGLIMQGLTNQQIAGKLFISFETVRSHRKNILEKSGAKNTAALINHYHQTFFEK